MNRLALDFRYACRALWTRRGSTAAIVLLLGLGVAFATTMFALADPFLLRPLPYPSPEELVVVRIVRPTGGSPKPSWSEAPMPSLREWRDRGELFQGLAPFDPSPVVVRAGEETAAMKLEVLQLDRDVFRLLGQADPACESSATLRCLVLTASARERYFGGQPDPVGRVLPTLRGVPLQVAGVLPRGFVVPTSFHSASIDGIVLTAAASNDVRVSSMLLARRQRGVSSRTVESALQTALSAGPARTVRVEGLDTFITQFNRGMAWGAMAAAALILIVCGASVANLLFSRGFHRRGEIATRKALGASGRDLARLLAAELALLAALIVGTGVELASIALAVIRRVMPAQYAALGEPMLSPRMLMAAGIMGAGTLAISALVASLALRTRNTGALTPSAGGVRAGRALQFGIVMTQSALAMMLVTGTILLGRSYFNLFSQDTGFSRTATVVAASYPMMPSEELRRHIEDALERIRRVPGVDVAGAVCNWLIDGSIRIAGPNAVTAGGVRFPGSVLPTPVTAGFLEATGARLVAGRALNGTDVNRSGIVVNESFARAAWPDANAVGQVVGIDPRTGTVVGVVKDMYDMSLDQRPGPLLYYLLEQPQASGQDDTRVRFVVKTRVAGGDVSPLLVKAITWDNRYAVVTDVGTIGGRLTRSVAERVFATVVMTLFALAAVTVCVAGLVGVVAFVTARRMRELAIRMAVGARPGHILSVVSANTLVAASIGLTIGLVVARFASALLQRVTYEVELNTWVTGIPAALVMLVIVLLSVGLTARRALGPSLVAVLRQE